MSKTCHMKQWIFLKDEKKHVKETLNITILWVSMNYYNIIYHHFYVQQYVVERCCCYNCGEAAQDKLKKVCQCKWCKDACTLLMVVFGPFFSSSRTTFCCGGLSLLHKYESKSNDRIYEHQKNWLRLHSGFNPSSRIWKF